MTAPVLLVWIVLAIVGQVAAAVAIAVRSRAATPTPALPPRVIQSAWPGLRTFRVATRAFEDPSHSQCSFRLVPIDGVALPPFTPGQFLTVVVPVATAPVADADVTSVESTSRCYSLSDSPHPDGYRITVKRVGAPPDRPDLPAGLVSNHLHDRVAVGTTLEVRAPSGQFTIDPDPSVPVVLIAGGIGVTPLLSMLVWCLSEQPARRVVLFYGVRSGADHAFRDVLQGLAATHAQFDLHVLYGAPAAGEVEGRDFRHRGFITLDLIQGAAPAGGPRYYVCGPAPMMELIVPGLIATGVPASHVHFEAFGPATVRRAPGEAVISTTPLDVHFRSSGRTLTWDGTSPSLLEFAASHDITIPAGCRSGSCGTCETRLLAGQVAYANPPEYVVAEGCCLPCVAVPSSAVELDA